MDDDRIKRSSVAWEPVAAAACFIGSVLSVGTGFVLTTGWLLDALVHPLLHAVGLFLLIAGIPILILAGHFMDLREKKLNQSGRFGSRSGEPRVNVLDLNLDLDSRKR